MSIHLCIHGCAIGRRCDRCGGVAIPDSSKVSIPVLPSVESPVSRELVKEIAMDIGKEVAAYIEVMYPQAVKAAASTMLLSVRNKIHSEIMVAIDVTGEREIRERLAARKVSRRKWKADYRNIRERDWDAIRKAKDVP